MSPNLAEIVANGDLAAIGMILQPFVTSCYGVKLEHLYCHSFSRRFSRFSTRTQSTILISYKRINGAEATTVLNISGGVMMLATITMIRMAYLRTLRR